MVGIIDYGLGNLGSIQNMFRVIGEKSVISSSGTELGKCDHLVLPGVGAFDAGMTMLEERKLADFIHTQVIDEQKPILGICLGMQLLGIDSEEGIMSGLGLIPFHNVYFKLENSELKVPHMGWDVVVMKQNKPLVNGLTGIQRYYFVHSYHAVCENASNVLMTCDYGYEFAAAVVKDNIYGVQFHPEKSHDFGMHILENFVRNC